MDTFDDLFRSLFEYDSVVKFVEEKWNGKDKLESVFRLFVFLKLIPQFRNFDVYVGDFNNGKLDLCTDLQKFKSIKLKNWDNASDLTLKSDNNMVVGSCRNICYSVGHMGISEIKMYLDRHYSDKQIFWWFLVLDKNDLITKAKNCNEMFMENVSIILTAYNNGFVFDINDLESAFTKFKFEFSKIQTWL